VHGNVDEEALRRALPAEIEVEIGPWTVAVTHDAGPASHLPLHESEQGFQIFNPGSPTERRRAPRPSMGLLSCEEAGLTFEHVWF